MPIKALIWNDLATEIISSPDLFCWLPPSGRDEAKSERPRQALSTVIMLIFEGFAGLAYLTVFIRRELPRTRHRGLKPHNAFCEDSPFRAASAVQSSLHR